MTLFKFLVPDDRYYSIPGSSVSARGCVAVVVAEDEAEARRVVEDASALAGKDARWLAVAIVSEIPLDKPRLVAVAF